MDALTIYVVSIAGDLKVTASVLAVVLGFVFVVTVVDFIKTGDDDEKHWVRRFAAAFVLALALAIFTPSTRTLATMHILPKIVNGDQLKQIGDETYNLAIEWMKSLKPRKEDEEK